MPDELAELLVVEAEDTVATGSLGYVCQLIEAGLNELATQPRRAQALLEKLRDRADRAAAAGGLHRHDERSLLETASLLAKELGEAEQARAFQEQAARSYEYEASERAEQGALIESALLQDAARAYASVGMSEDLMRVKGLLHDASRRSLDEMKSVSSSVSVPHERLERAVDDLLSTGHELGDHGVYYAVALTTGVWPPWSDIQSQTEELKETAPLQYLVRKVRVGPDGQPLPRPTDEGAAQEFDEGETYVRNLQIVLQFISWAVVALRERNEWTATGLRDAILRSPHFADAELAIEAGTEAFEANRHWDALHVLVPQLERGLRRIAQLLGVDVYTYRSASGRLEWASLSRILTAEPVQAFLNRVRPALALELDLLLSNPAGLNLRNDVAHGVLDPNQDAYAYSLLVALILLVLATPDLDPDTIQSEAG